MLSSDILENQFGPTRVNVLYQDNTDRIIQTVTFASEKVLELSWVKFDPEGKEVFAEIHSAVAEGESMGKAFREAGQPFNRETRALGRLILPDSYRQRFDSRNPATVTETDIFVGEDQIFYCHVLETFSPDINWPLSADSCQRPSRAKVLDFADFLDAAAPL